MNVILKFLFSPSWCQIIFGRWRWRYIGAEMKFWNLKHFFELTLVENEVLDLSGQRLHRFVGRFHFEIDVVGAFESTFLLFLFEHTMTLFRFSNNLLGSSKTDKIEHIISWISVPARDKTIILFWRSISFGSAFRLNSHLGSSYCFAALSSTEFKSDSSTSFSFPFDVVIYIVSFQKRLWWWLVERPSQIKLRRIIFTGTTRVILVDFHIPNEPWWVY